MSKTVYLAGPMRGVPEFNFPAFEEAQALLEECGYTVISPAEHDRLNGFDPSGMTGYEDLSKYGFDLKRAFAWDMVALILHADMVVTLPLTAYSLGAMAEVRVAEAMGIPVMNLEGALDAVHSTR